MLFILTDVDGLYDGIPKKSKIIRTITKITDELLEIASPDSSSGKGTGGMKTKLIAAKIAASSGTTTFITNGSKLSLIEDAVNGKDIGTKFCLIKNFNQEKHG